MLSTSQDEGRYTFLKESDPGLGKKWFPAARGDSDRKCGSYTDKSILQASKAMDRLNTGYVALADRGFQIEQICRDRGIAYSLQVSLRGYAKLTLLEITLFSGFFVRSVLELNRGGEWTSRLDESRRP